jgi:hypothetical protein
MILNIVKPATIYNLTIKINTMQKISLLIIAFTVICFTIIACSGENTTKKEEAVPVTKTLEETIQQGKYLVGIMGCNDCHSPKKMGPNGPEIIPELLLSGYPSDRPIVKFDSKLIKEGFAMLYPDLTAGAGPWGVSFAGNLTPHETGLGNWTEEQFKKALTKGKFKGLDEERMLLPTMPWTNYINLTDADTHAIFMYLKSIPPVSNRVPAPVTPDKM